MRLFLIIIFLHSISEAYADIAYQPLSFKLSTEKDSYYEGEKVTFIISITNTDTDNSHPILLPHTQNTGHKLFYLNLYDKANNTLILRATEDQDMKMMVHDTGSVKIYHLKPQETITYKIYWNDFENYYNYHTQNASHHSFGVPLFAGEYKINVIYAPFNQTLGKDLYTYHNNFKSITEESEKLVIPEIGLQSNFHLLKIKKSPEKELKIEGETYISWWDEESAFFWYYKDSVGTFGANPRLVHITNLPPDSSTLAKGEYFYSHFTDIYAEYVVRFDNGDIKEYRKYRDFCPDALYTEKYNEFGKLFFSATQLPDGRFYSVAYHQPSGNKHQEKYFSRDGTICNIYDYIYDRNGKFVKTKLTQTEPCVYNLEYKRSFYKMDELKAD